MPFLLLGVEMNLLTKSRRPSGFCSPLLARRPTRRRRMWPSPNFIEPAREIAALFQTKTGDSAI